MADDDQTWLDALAGRARDAREPAALEGEALRAALLRTRVPEDAAASGRNAQREAELLARAEREGLIVRRPRRGLRERLGFAPAWAFAVLACVLAGTVLLVDRTALPPVVERADDDIVRLEAADPGALKERILADLRAAGVAATGYERLGVQGIDADLPQPPTAEVLSVLKRHGLPAPADGVLRVEIAAP